MDAVKILLKKKDDGHTISCKIVLPTNGRTDKHSHGDIMTHQFVDENYGRAGVQTEGKTNGCTNGPMDVPTDGLTNERTKGWTDQLAEMIGC